MIFIIFRYFVPKQVGISNDTRELSYRLYYIEAD